MKHKIKGAAALLPLCGLLLGQTAVSPTQQVIFHVEGVVKNSTGSVVYKAKVTFQSAQLSKTVETKPSGFYAADLPLGVYTMTVEGPLSRPYRRPAFQAKSPADLTFNATLPPVLATIDRTEDHRPGESEDAATRETYNGEDFFEVPSDDAVPFQVYIRYVSRTVSSENYIYAGDNAPPYQNPVFVAYNLFSLQANRITYDEKKRTLKATGNVVILMANESGVVRVEHEAYFRIENGHVIPVKTANSD